MIILRSSHRGIRCLRNTRPNYLRSNVHRRVPGDIEVHHARTMLPHRNSITYTGNVNFHVSIRKNIQTLLNTVTFHTVNNNEFQSF